MSIWNTWTGRRCRKCSGSAPRLVSHSRSPPRLPLRSSGTTARVSLPELPGDSRGAATAGSGSRLAVRGFSRYAGAVDAPHAGDQLGTAAGAIRGSLRSQISEGTLVNLLRSARERVAKQISTVLERVRASRVVCSDEPPVRVAGRTWRERVYVSDGAALPLRSAFRCRSGATRKC